MWSIREPYAEELIKAYVPEAEYYSYEDAVMEAINRDMAAAQTLEATCLEHLVGKDENQT